MRRLRGTSVGGRFALLALLVVALVSVALHAEDTVSLYIRTEYGYGSAAFAASLTPATRFYVRVESLCAVSSVDIEVDFSLDGGLSWVEIGRTTSPTGTAFCWLVPDTESDSCLIRAIDHINGTETTTELFSIGPHLVGEIPITSPAPGESIPAGLHFYVQYEPFHLESDISEENRDIILEYSLDGGSTWTIARRDAMSSRTWCPWYSVPDVESDNCYIRMRSRLYPGMVGISGPFSIRRDCPCPEDVMQADLGWTSWDESGGTYRLRAVRVTLMCDSILSIDAWHPYHEWPDYRPIEYAEERVELYLDKGEYTFILEDLFGESFDVTDGELYLEFRANCTEGTPSCRTSEHPLPLRANSPATVESRGPVTNAGYLSSYTHWNDSETADPSVGVVLTPLDAFYEADIMTLRCYWGIDPDDEQEIRDGAIDLPPDWRHGLFEAVGDGEWILALWGEDGAGNKTTEVMSFCVRYAEAAASMIPIGELVSSSHSIGVVTGDPILNIKFVPDASADMGGVEELEYYWGPDPQDDDTLVVSMSQSLPMSWRSGQFTATEPGAWLFVLWGENAEGQRVTEWMQFAIHYAPDNHPESAPLGGSGETVQVSMLQADPLWIDGNSEIRVTNSAYNYTHGDGIPSESSLSMKLFVDGVEVPMTRVVETDEYLDFCWFYKVRWTGILEPGELGAGSHTFTAWFHGADDAPPSDCVEAHGELQGFDPPGSGDFEVSREIIIVYP